MQTIILKVLFQDFDIKILTLLILNNFINFNTEYLRLSIGTSSLIKEPKLRD